MKEATFIINNYGYETLYICKTHFKNILEKEGLMSKILLLCFEPTITLGKDIIENMEESSFVSVINNKYNEITNPNVINFYDYSNIQNNINIEGYTTDKNNKYYKYNYILDDTDYYCNNNIVIRNGILYRYSNNYILMDYFLINLDKCTIKRLPNKDYDTSDGLIKAIGNIKNINLENNILTITSIKNGDFIIELDENNCINKITNNKILEIPDNFGKHLQYIRDISLPNALKINNNFLENAFVLRSIDTNNALYIGDDFNLTNEYLNTINAPNALYIGDNFLYSNYSIRNLNINPKKVGNNFLYENRNLNNITFNNLVQVGDNFMANDDHLSNISLPNLKYIGDYFLYSSKISNIVLPNVTTIGDYFMDMNEHIESIDMPNLVECNSKYLLKNRFIKKNIPDNVLCNGDVVRTKVLKK